MVATIDVGQCARNISVVEVAHSSCSPAWSAAIISWAVSREKTSTMRSMWASTADSPASDRSRPKRSSAASRPSVPIAAMNASRSSPEIRWVARPV